MLTIEPTTQTLGARILGADLSKPLGKQDFRTIFKALGDHAVLVAPKQEIAPAQLRDFASRFGGLQYAVTGQFQEEGVPEVMILSNIVENGKAIGLADAGQDWHTDMSYMATVGFVNVLYALEVPHRDGRPLGDTVFANMYAAYDDLPDMLKNGLAGCTVTHDFAKYWNKAMQKPGTQRKPLTDEQRRKTPAVSHPLFLTHPISGKKVLYANPGYAVRINELPEEESARMLDLLFAHQLQPKYQFAHKWSVGDVLFWDHISTLHFANPDYRPDERRLMKRCQVLADRVFDKAFVDGILKAA